MTWNRLISYATTRGHRGTLTGCLMLVFLSLFYGGGAGAGHLAPLSEQMVKSAIGAEPSSQAADLVLVNAKVWTGVKALSDKPAVAPEEPTALAVIGDTITAVGSDEAIRKRIGPNTRIIDAKGRRVIPGITDSHTHIISGGLQLQRLNLRDVRNRGEFIRAVETEAKNKQAGEWVLGGRWSVESWEKSEPPQKNWLDPVTGDTPVFLDRMDGHSALANSAALKLAGIDAAGPADPTGGEIERDPKTREPTGILKESAMDLVSKLIPPLTVEVHKQALHRAMQHANSLGITSVHDMSNPDDLGVFQQVIAAEALTLRITSYVQVSDFSAGNENVLKYKSMFEYGKSGQPTVDIAGFKGYMDGSLGSRNAYMREPFSDATPEMPYPRGQLTAFAASTESFQAAINKVDAAGLQIAIHAIGDQANHLVLDAYEKAAQDNHRTGMRHRIEHAQHLLISDIPRFARLGVIASMQPYHKADDGRYAEKALGKERLAGSYAFRQLLDAGALLCFGSDWPVVTLNPFAGIDSAVNSKTLAGDIWLPAHAITVEEALRCYTVNPPRAIHREDRLGTLEVGKLADFVILSDDPLTIPQARLAGITVEQTIVAGKVVYTASK